MILPKFLVQFLFYNLYHHPLYEIIKESEELAVEKKISIFNRPVLQNQWKHITIWCMNHETPMEMQVVQNTDAFKTAYYGCPGKDGHPCANKLYLDDYQGIIYRLFSIIADDPFSNHKNRVFDYYEGRQKFEVTILKYRNDDIRLGIKNRTILG